MLVVAPGGTGETARRLRIVLAAARDAGHAVAHEEHHVERRGDQADARLDAPAERELPRSAVGHGGECTIRGMEGFGGFFNDPDLARRLQEMAEQMQSTQTLAWADNAIKLAVDMTVAAIDRVNLQGSAEDQAKQIRQVMTVVFPEAVTLVREARQGLS